MANIPVFGQATNTQSLTVGPDVATFDIDLDNATGDEVALDLQYTTDKATSGDDTGLVVNQTDTASPGTSLLTDFQVGGVSRFKFDNAGNATFTGVMLANKVTATGSSFQSSWTNPGTVGAFTYSNAITAIGDQIISLLAPTYNQASGTASNTDLLINRTETAVGSGTQLLIDAQVGGITKFNINTAGLIQNTAVAGITADTGSSQGDGPLTSSVNEISVCANVGDAVTLPAAVVNISYSVMIINNGAQACDVFPASGDNLGAGADTASSLAAGANITYVSYDDTNWVVKV